MSTPRGIRNNNPGNIDYSPANAWLGQLKHDPAVEARFARFDSPQNGIRALGKLLGTYQRKHGLKTVQAIISRWAPSQENDTAAYVRSVESKIPGIKPGADVDVSNPVILRAFVVAIIEHENGTTVRYSPALIDEGVRRALL